MCILIRLNISVIFSCFLGSSCCEKKIQSVTEDLPDSLEAIIDSPLGTCTSCAKQFYVALFVSLATKEQALKLYREHLQQDIEDAMLEIDPKFLYTFGFCSLKCQNDFHVP